MIGANNYGFAAIVERCVTNWATSPSWWKNYCSDDSDMTSRFTAARQAQETTNVSDALLRVRDAMADAGYSDVAVQDHRPDLLVADPARRAASATRETRLDAPVDRRLRRLEPRRQLGERHRRAGDERQRAQRRRRRPGSPTSSCSTSRTRSSAGGCARPASACSRRSGRELAEPRRGRPDGVGRADPHRDDDLRPLPAAGGRPRELLGPAGDAQLPAARLQRRRRPRRPLRARRQRAQLARGAADGAAQ